MKRYQYLTFLIAIAFLISLIPVGKSNSTVINPGIFVNEVAALAPSTLDPASNYESQGGGFIHLMYEGLFTYSNNSVTDFVPSLALNYTVSPDGLQYNFTLRTGVTFALQPGEVTGQPFNAYVMQYSIDRAIIMNDHSGPAWMIQDWIKGAQTVEYTSDLNQTQANIFLSQKSVLAIDATHLVITLAQPFSGFIQTLQFPVAYAISPKAIIDNEPSTYTILQNDVYGMVSLASMFPGIANATILSNLGLPGNYNIDNSGIVPQSDSSGLAAYVWLQNHSAGSGPYYLVDLYQGVNADFAKNTNWWNSANFAPNSVNAIKWIQVGDVNTRLSDLESGNADFGDIAVSYISPVVNLTTFQSSYPGISSYVYNQFITWFIGMTESPTLPTGQIVENATSSNYSYNGNNVTRLLKYSWKDSSNNPQYASPGNPLSSLLFREALAYSFDQITYIAQSLYGLGFRMQGAIPKGFLGYDGNLIANGNIPTFNLTKAKQLFNEVGFKGSITISYNSGSSSRALAATLFKNAIESLGIGITVNVVALAWNSFLFAAYNGQLALWQLGWSPDFADPHDYTVPFYRTGNIFAYSLNYSNPNVDSLINLAATATDPTVRTSYYHQMEVNATGDYPYIYLAQTQTLLVLRSWIQGVNDPQTNSMNPMDYSLSYQYLNKADIITSTVSSTSTTAIPTSSSQTTTQSVTSTTSGTSITPGTSASSGTGTTNTTPSSTSSSGSQTSSSSNVNSGGSSSSSTSTSSINKITVSSPGFDQIAVLSFLFVSLVVVVRRRKN